MVGRCWSTGEGRAESYQPICAPGSDWGTSYTSAFGSAGVAPRSLPWAAGRSQSRFAVCCSGSCGKSQPSCPQPHSGPLERSTGQELRGLQGTVAGSAPHPTPSLEQGGDRRAGSCARQGRAEPRGRVSMAEHGCCLPGKVTPSILVTAGQDSPAELTRCRTRSSNNIVSPKQTLLTLVGELVGRAVAVSAFPQGLWKWPYSAVCLAEQVSVSITEPESY